MACEAPSSEMPGQLFSLVIARAMTAPEGPSSMNLAMLPDRPLSAAMVMLFDCAPPTLTATGADAGTFAGTSALI